MSLSNSFHAYSAEYAVLDRALDSSRGIRIPVDTYDAALTYRHRLNHARSVDRARSREVYEPGDPSYSTSAYDPLITRVKRDGETIYVYVEHNRVPAGIENLPDENEEGSGGLPKWLPVVDVGEPSLED